MTDLHDRWDQLLNAPWRPKIDHYTLWQNIENHYDLRFQHFQEFRVHFTKRPDRPKHFSHLKILKILNNLKISSERFSWVNRGIKPKPPRDKTKGELQLFSTSPPLFCLYPVKWKISRTHITILIETETNISLESKEMRGNVNTQKQDNKQGS